MMNIISNSDEYSRTVKRSDGSNLDLCAFRSDRELIIGITNDNGENYQNITLSAQEVEQLLYHLIDPRTQQVFRAL